MPLLALASGIYCCNILQIHSIASFLFADNNIISPNLTQNSSISTKVVILREGHTQCVGNVQDFQTAEGGVRVYSSPKSNATAGICVIVKNETIYLDEWADFHIALGFKNIVIYDNSPSPDRDLKCWLDAREDLHGHVKIIHFPDSVVSPEDREKLPKYVPPVQVKAYDQCIKENASNHTYVGLFDVDEFLVLKKHTNVVDFLNDHCNETCGQIGIHWRIMGTSNETKYRPVPVLKRNIHYSVGSLNAFIKPIVRPSYVSKNIDWLHSVSLKQGVTMDTSGKKIPRNRKSIGNDDKPSDVALFYHYRFKSEEEFKHKTCGRGDLLKDHCNKKSYEEGMSGRFYDDTAWELLKKIVPKYALYEELR